MRFFDHAYLAGIVLSWADLPVVATSRKLRRDPDCLEIVFPHGFVQRTWCELVGVDPGEPS